MLDQFALEQEHKGYGIFHGADPWVIGVFLVVPGACTPILLGRTSEYVTATSIEEAKQLIDGANDPNSELAQWLKALQQRQVWQLEHEKWIRDGIRVFLRLVCEPGRILSEDTETTINCWIAAIDKELCALNYNVTDDLLQAVAQGNCDEISAPVQELVANRRALMHLLSSVEGNDRLDQRLTAAIGNREEALALTKQLESGA
jgi:hypothetical protein